MISEYDDKVSRCVECISPTDYQKSEEYLSEEDPEANYHVAFKDNDSEGFRSDFCIGCDEGLVPGYIPEEQVIKYIKRIFDIRNITM